MILKRIFLKEYYIYVKEMIFMFQLFVCVFEIVVVGRFYSVWVGFSCFFVFLVLKNVEFIFEGVLVNLCGIFEDVVYK